MQALSLPDLQKKLRMTEELTTDGLAIRTSITFSRIPTNSDRWIAQECGGLFLAAKPASRLGLEPGVCDVLWARDAGRAMGNVAAPLLLARKLAFYVLFAAFAMVAAVFWAHTSHRVYLDVYWIVFAAGALAKAPSGSSVFDAPDLPRRLLAFGSPGDGHRPRPALQARMGSGFHNSAFVEDVNDVGVHGGGEAVRDHEPCLSLGESTKTAQPILLRPGIHDAGGSSRMTTGLPKKALARAILCHSPALNSSPPNHLPRSDSKPAGKRSTGSRRPHPQRHATPEAGQKVRRDPRRQYSLELSHDNEPVLETGR